MLCAFELRCRLFQPWGPQHRHSHLALTPPGAVTEWTPSPLNSHLSCRDWSVQRSWTLKPLIHSCCSCCIWRGNNDSVSAVFGSVGAKQPHRRVTTQVTKQKAPKRRRAIDSGCYNRAWCRRAYEVTDHVPPPWQRGNTHAAHAGAENTGASGRYSPWPCANISTLAVRYRCPAGSVTSHSAKPLLSKKMARI